MVIAKNWPFLPNHSTTVIPNEVNKHFVSISFLGFPGKVVKNPRANVGEARQEDPLEKEMVTQSSILPWKIPWAEEPGGLQFMGS